MVGLDFYALGKIDLINTNKQHEYNIIVSIPL